MKSILRLLAVLVVPAMSFSTLLAQEVAYRIGWGSPNSHLYDVEMRFQNPESGPVSVRIPAWRPGRYVIQNYAKNIIRFSASDGEGTALAFRKTDKGTWEIDAAPSQEVVVSYQAYSKELNGGSSYLDDQEAYINPITLLMYIPGQEMLPVTLSVKRPDGWKAATQLAFDSRRNLYLADNYHEVVDGPLIISPTLELHSFEFAGATFEVAIQGSLEADRQQLLQDLQKIVEVQVNMMGVIPFDRYVFLYHFVDQPIGHGVEHKNSTSIVLGPPSKPDFYKGILSVSAHELFHAWNVERIRPEAIYYPDYSSEQYTTTFWIYEGVTSYYTSLTLVRSGLITEDEFLRRIAGSINSFESSYGKNVTSIAMSSWDSWTKGEQAPPNTYFSFYTAGEIIGLLLDMEVRGRTRNRQSLESVMQYLYAEYAARGRGVPEDGLQRAIETITTGTIAPFFEAHIHGTEQIEYDRYLYHAGYRLAVTEDPNVPSVTLGIQLAEGQNDVVISSVVPESAAFEAGLYADDALIALNGRRVTQANLNDVLDDIEPGQTVAATIFRRNQLQTIQIPTRGGGNSKYELVRLPDTSTLQNQTRRDWMNLAAG
ncbi:MAG TPA: PDZ domain-containing protein [Rhodothermia bacterium]|nr:PDZ domain-containing protein [Rhodothermia bacterium]